MGTISAATTAMSGTSRARRWTVLLIDVLLLGLDIGSASRPARRRASHGGRATEKREKAQSVLISDAHLCASYLMPYRRPYTCGGGAKGQRHGGRGPRTARCGFGVCRAADGWAGDLHQAAAGMPDTGPGVLAGKGDTAFADRRRLRRKPSSSRRPMCGDRRHAPGVRPGGAIDRKRLGRTDRWPPSRYLVASLDDLDCAAELPPPGARQGERRTGRRADPLQVTTGDRDATADGGGTRLAQQGPRMERHPSTGARPRRVESIRSCRLGRLQAWQNQSADLHVGPSRADRHLFRRLWSLV